MILSVLNFLEQFCNLHKSKVYHMPIVNKKKMTVTSTLYWEYFLILDFNYHSTEEKDLKTNNLRELACKKNQTNRIRTYLT